MVMGDNGPMKHEIPGSSYSQWLLRGIKGQALEGGHRVGAFVKWSGVTKPGSIAGDGLWGQAQTANIKKKRPIKKQRVFVIRDLVL